MKNQRFAKNSFIGYIKTDQIYKDIAEDDETRFDTSNCELDKQLPKGKHKHVIELIKYQFGWKIVVKLVELRAIAHSYLIGDCSEEKKQKAQRSAS